MEESNVYQMYKKVYYMFLGLFAVLTAIFIVYRFFPFPIVLQRGDCGFSVLLHLYCPGCMGTHALIEFMNMHFIKSFAYNPFVDLTAYLMIRYLFEGGYTFLIKKDGKLYFKLKYWDIYFCIGFFLLFGIVRDILLVLGVYDYGGRLIQYWVR